MKVFLDARTPFGGIGRHVRWLRRSLEEHLGPDGCVIYGGDGRVRPVPPRVRSWPRAAAGALKRIAVDQLDLPRRVAKSGAGVFHSPNYLVPRRISVPAVVNCYDLTLLDLFDTKKRGPVKFYERQELIGALGRARFVVTPSRSVRAELLDRFELDPDRVVTIYHLPTEFSERLEEAGEPSESWLPEVARGPFFLSVGTLEPRKNLGRLLEAHTRIWRDTRVPLVLAGPYGWRQRALLRQVRDSAGAVHWLGWVPDALLGALFRKATAVVQPSLAEGLDLPVLEAMAAGRPLVLSDLAVHREVAEDLALYAPASEVATFEKRMREVLLWHGERRSDHARRAAARVESFRARSGIELYLEVYRRAWENREGRFRYC